MFVCLFVCLFVGPPYYSQRAVFASPLSALLIDINFIQNDLFTYCKVLYDLLTSQTIVVFNDRITLCSVFDR